MKESVVKAIVMVIVGLVLAAFYILGVFGKPDCDIDAVYLGCRLHPFTFLDFIGTAMFTACGLYLGGFLKGFKFDPWGTGAKWNYIAFAVGVLGIILIWNT